MSYARASIISSFAIFIYLPRSPFTSNRYIHLLYVDHCLILYFVLARRSSSAPEPKGGDEKLCEALQSFSGWCIAFYIGVDQGRSRR